MADPTTPPSAPTPISAAAALVASTPPAPPAGDPPAPVTPPADGTTPPAANGETPPADAPKADEPPALKMPGKDATPEDWDAFYKQIGRPDTPDAYELPLPEGDDGTFAKEVAPLLHKANITGEQAKLLASEWNSFVAQKMAAQDAADAQAAADHAAAMHAKNTAEAEALQNEWGANNTANMELSRRAVQQFMPKDKATETIAAIESVLGYKGTIQFLHNIGKGMAEHDAPGLGGNNGGTAAPKTLAERMYPHMKP